MTANRMASFFARITSEDSDADLLRRYISSRDALAFEILVRRHGSLVFAIVESPNSAVTVQLPFDDGAGGATPLPPGRLGIWDFSK